MTLENFVKESNRIEGITRDPTWQEVDAHKQFLALDTVMIQDLQRFVGVCQPGAKLRDETGMNVRVGNHVPPDGGLEILNLLAPILSVAVGGRNRLDRREAHSVHMLYENLHPFMDCNGRSGRVLWLWMMRGEAPLGFLHHFYYQTLSANGR